VFSRKWTTDVDAAGDAEFGPFAAADDGRGACFFAHRSHRLACRGCCYQKMEAGSMLSNLAENSRGSTWRVSSLGKPPSPPRGNRPETSDGRSIESISRNPRRPVSDGVHEGRTLARPVIAFQRPIHRSTFQPNESHPQMFPSSISSPKLSTPSGNPRPLVNQRTKRSTASLVALTLGLAACSGTAIGGSSEDAGADASHVVAQAAVVWNVTPGTNSAAGCSAVDDTWEIGNPESAPIVTVPNGGTSNGVPVTVNCVVAPKPDGYTVVANVQYGNDGALTVTGLVTVGANGQAETATAMSGVFNDNLGLVANLSQNNCTVTFTQNPNMGIAAGRIWGVIDCPQATTTTGSEVCDGHAEFIFEGCAQ
jgi:hypothetical protein